ncbi:capsule assembly Wzi family protein [Dyadobacter tibetensis]|uniref:capsule assembly Wzi family protein n=1 Tax=Dyadobacter tibetensis TaxID=1211851 RepID=UPI000471AC60|nr:capsule assembly Wzi family protein [Dyadobacter tibetensis]
MRYFLLVLIFIGYQATFAQDSTLFVNMSITGSGFKGATPFWQSANSDGTVPADQAQVVGQWSLYKVYNIHNPRKLQWSAGASLITSYSPETKANFFLTDLYQAVKLGPWELMVGQKRQNVGLSDSTMGLGGLAISRNARPFPRIQIGLKDFQPIHLANDFIAWKISISEGLLGNSQINYGPVSQVPNTYLHQKQVYFRLGIPESKWMFFLGMNHQAIWGGESEFWPKENPSKWTAYKHMVTGTKYQHNIVGNHFGSFDLAFNIKTIPNLELLAYRNSVFSNGSIFKVNNLQDALTGIRVRFPKAPTHSKIQLKAITIEYLDLENQKSRFSNNESILYAEADYYNSYRYRRGWSYFGNSLGSPIIRTAAHSLPEFAGNLAQFTNNNLLKAIHLAVEANILQTHILAKSTHSWNRGTYLAPFSSTTPQWSGYLGLERSIPSLQSVSLNLGIVSDIGQLYGNNTSLILSVRKSGFLN